MRRWSTWCVIHGQRLLGRVERDPEVRAAIRRAFQIQIHLKTEEAMEETVDCYVQQGWAVAFRLYHAKHGRYPDHTELTEAANMASEERRKDG
jgi:hypothetical protein